MFSKKTCLIVIEYLIRVLEKLEYYPLFTEYRCLFDGCFRLKGFFKIVALWLKRRPCCS